MRRWSAVAIAVVTVAVMLVAGIFIGRATIDNNPAPDSNPAPLSATDLTFAQNMLMHHQQAVLIVSMLARDAAPDVAAMAQQITTTQSEEIGQMRGWLGAVGQPEQPAQTGDMQTGDKHSGDMHSGDMHGDAHMSPNSMMMPGMANDDELTQLHDSTGKDNEKLFLQLMIRHHQGGIGMAIAERKNGHNAAVTATANRMQVEQSREVDLMTTLLTARGGSPLPFAAS